MRLTKDTNGPPWLGVWLMLAAMGAVVGEGVCWFGLGCASLSLLARGLPMLPRSQQPILQPVSSALAVFFLCALTANILGPVGGVSLAGLSRWAPILALYIVALGLRSLGRPWPARLAWAFGAALAVAALMSIVAWAWDWDWQQGEGWVRQDQTMAGQGRVPGTARRAAGGFYFHRLKMAHVLLIGMGLGFGASLDAGMKRFGRALVGLGQCLFVTALVLTFARAAWLAALMGLAAALVSLLRNHGALRAPRVTRLGVLFLLAACVAGVGYGVPSVAKRVVSTFEQQANDTRAMIWAQAAQIIYDHPQGVGLGNYAKVVGDYYDWATPTIDAPRTNPHNVPLMAWAEAGPLGALALACALWRFVVGVTHVQPPQLTASVAAVFVVVAFFGVGAVHDVLFHNIVALTFWGFVGAIIGSSEASSDAANAIRP